MPAWLFMWTMAGALYAACKWLTFRDARARGVAAGGARTLGYLLLWPGMDAAAFLAGDAVRRPQASEWLAAAAKTLFGAALTWIVARAALPAREVLAGWLAMIGISQIPLTPSAWR